MNDNTQERAELIRVSVEALTLADLPKKPILVKLAKAVIGSIGDYDRMTKGDLLAKLDNATRAKIDDALVAMVYAGELELDLDDEPAAPTAAPAPALPASVPAAAYSAPLPIPAAAADAVEQLRAAFQALGVAGQAAAAPLDEDAVTSLILRECAPLLRANLDHIMERVEAKLADRPARTVVLQDNKPAIEIEGATHERFDYVLRLAKLRENIMLIGPAGCGKTKLAHQVADGLGLSFGMLSLAGGTSESQLQGWLLPIEAGGKFSYVPAGFVKAYENGGVFLLDEVDAADENMLLVINAALANGHMHIAQRHENPVVKRHPDFVCIAAANTFGHGGDLMYAGRNRLDASTIDRFLAGTVVMDYDLALEQQLCHADVLTMFHPIRRRIVELKLRRIVSTRVLLNFTNMVNNGFTLDECKTAFFAAWPRDERSKVGA